MASNNQFCDFIGLWCNFKLVKTKIVEWFNDIHDLDENEFLRIWKRVVIMFSTNNLASKILMFSKKITTWICTKFFLMGLLISAIRYSFWSEVDHIMPSTTHHWYYDFQIRNNCSLPFSDIAYTPNTNLLHHTNREFYEFIST